MIKILFEDKYLLICEKKAGTVSEMSDAPCSLPNIIEREYSECSQSISLHTLHRLDKEVCGAIVYAKDPFSAAKMSSLISTRQLKKEYLAIIEGIPDIKDGRLCDLLFRDAKRNKSFVVDRKRNGVKEAVLDYTVLASGNNTSLVKIELHTGRTHQIRVQFSSRGHAIIGDRKYGSKVKAEGIALCSHKLEFIHPITDKPCSVTYYPEANGIWESYEDILNNKDKH